MGTTVQDIVISYTIFEFQRYKERKPVSVARWRSAFPGKYHNGAYKGNLQKEYKGKNKTAAGTSPGPEPFSKARPYGSRPWSQP